MLQLAVAVPIVVNCIAEELPTLLTGIFTISTITAIIFYFILAFTNPGYLIGSGTDVNRRAGAYNPKDYQVESNRKEVQSAE